MFEWIVGKAAVAGVSGIAGVLSGFVGNIVTQVVNLKMLKEKNRHDEMMVTERTKAAILEAEANMKIVQTQADAAVKLAEMDAFAASIKQASDTLFKESYMGELARSPWTAWLCPVVAGMFAVVDFATRLARPVLTYYHVLVTSYITWLLWQWIRANQVGVMDAGLVVNLFVNLVFTVIYMTATIVGWWFCDRQVAKFAAGFLGKRP